MLFRFCCQGDAKRNFGSILPILTYSHLEEALAFIESESHPLACYVFSSEPYLSSYYQKHLLLGVGCFNDMIMQFTNE